MLVAQIYSVLELWSGTSQNHSEGCKWPPSLSLDTPDLNYSTFNMDDVMFTVIWIFTFTFTLNILTVMVTEMVSGDRPQPPSWPFEDKRNRSWIRTLKYFLNTFLLYFYYSILVLLADWPIWAVHFCSFSRLVGFFSTSTNKALIVISDGLATV